MLFYLFILFELPHPRLVLDFDLLVFAFGQIPVVVCTWICMFLSVLVVPYALFHLWSQSQLGSYSHPRLCTFLSASVYMLYQVFGLGFLPTYIVVTNSLPPASRFIVIMEQVRDHIPVHILPCLRIFLNI